MTAQMKAITRNLWTPVGLRTLSPSHPAYRPRCEGDQATRDRAYHQGPPWAWLGGHYEMARNRMVGARDLAAMELGLGGSIEGHVPELFDAEAPYLPRGTPAQAWSIACFEEAQARAQRKIDSKLTQLLARRWMDRQPPLSGDRKESTA